MFSASAMAATFRFCTKPPGEHHVHLIDVEAVVLDEVTVLVDLSVQLAAGHMEGGALAQLCQSLEVVAVQGLLDPLDADLLEGTAHVQSLLQIPLGHGPLAGEEPALIGVHGDLQLVAYPLFDLGDDTDVLEGIVVVSTELHHLEALGNIPLSVLHTLLHGLQGAGAGVGQNLVLHAAQHLIDGEIGVFAQCIPHGYLHAPGAVGVQGGVDEAGVDGLYLRDLLADDQRADVGVQIPASSWEESQAAP